MQVLKLTAVFEVVARLQFDVLVQCLLDVGYYLLNVRVAYVHTNHDTAFGSVAVDLQRTADKFDACHLADRNLNAFGSTHKELVQI